MWNGTEYRTATTGQLNGRIGYLFQNPDAQIFLPTVFDELALGLRKQGLTRAQVRERVESTCEIFSLPDPQAPPALMTPPWCRRARRPASPAAVEADLG